MSRPVMFLLIFSLLSAPFIVSGVQAITCEGCHTSSNASGGYVYEDPIINIIRDPFYLPDEDFQISLVIRPQPDYEMRSLEGTISLEGSVLSLVSTDDSVGEILENGDISASWALRGNMDGEANVLIDFEYEVYFKHGSPGNKDIGTYFDRITSPIRIADLSLSISPGTMVLSRIGETASITLTADEQVNNIVLQMPGALQGIVELGSQVSSLSTGETATIQVTLLEEMDFDGQINISWQESSGEKTIPVSLKIAPLKNIDTGEDLFLRIGQITGISSISLVIIGYFTGGTGFMKKYANRLFRTAPRRVKFHCALSYLVMILVFWHLAVLWYGPYRELIFNTWEVILGEVAMLIMLVISVNGIFQKSMIRWWGFQNWKRIHSWGSYILTSLVVIHMITNGTHFLWLRQLIGMA